jgi:hypothetical protein
MEAIDSVNSRWEFEEFKFMLMRLVFLKQFSRTLQEKT